MNSSLRNAIIIHLTKKGNYDPGVDDYVIDELISNIELSRECLTTLKYEGVVQNYITTSGSKMSKMNPLVGIYQMFQRNIQQLAGKLGINRKDRIMLKLLEEKQLDQFDNDSR
jgi:phage terminase small subunit